MGAKDTEAKGCNVEIGPIVRGHDAEAPAKVAMKRRGRFDILRFRGSERMKGGRTDRSPVSSQSGIGLRLAWRSNIANESFRSRRPDMAWCKDDTLRARIPRRCRTHTVRPAGCAGFAKRSANGA